MAVRKARARWDGSITAGQGTMALGSGAYEGPYSFASRFEDGTGTNPEELIGAAHAGCYSMAFSNELAKAGLTPESVATKATVTLDTSKGADITAVLLETTATVPGADEAKVREIAEAAKKGCPVSKVLNAEITLTKTLQK